MENGVGFSSQESSERVMVFHGVFEKIINEVDSSKYHKSYLFNNNEFTKIFREYLYEINHISRKEELENKFGSSWTLRIVNKCDKENVINLEKKEFILDYSEYEKYYSSKKQISKSSKVLKELFDDNKKPNTVGITNIIKKISDRSNEMVFSQEQKKDLSKSIPEILINNNIKLEKQDVFDINKVAIEEVIEIGRGILNKEKKYEKILNINDISKEDAWQKYFEIYGSYLLFGNVRLNPKECLDKSKTGAINDKYPDLITCNRYGFLDIIELKKSDLYLFKFDNSHNNFVPTSDLSSAISQLNNYLQIIPYAYKAKDAQEKGLQCSSGMILIGDKKHLVKEGKHLNEYKEKNNLSNEDIIFIVQQELRKLNYSYSYIQVVLYDELIDNLENFISQIK